MEDQAKLSIVIVAYNSRSDLEHCLPSLYQSDLCLEIIVVDNASADGTVAWLEAEHPEVRVIALDQNSWYAGGNNVGMRAAHGEYVLVLNPDTVVEPGALPIMIEAARSHPRALVTPKLLLPDGTINACGNQMQYTGIAICVGLGRPAEDFHGMSSPLLLSGAAILASRAVWRDLDGFDESHQMYVEDTDLSLRARLKGYDLLCAADAVITHYYTLGMKPWKFRFLERNRLLTVLKIYETGTLLRMVPALLLTSLATAAFSLMGGSEYRTAWLRAYADVWRQRSRLRASRAQLQSERVVPDRTLLAAMESNLPFDQLMARARLANLLSRLTTPVYRLLKPA